MQYQPDDLLYSSGLQYGLTMIDAGKVWDMDIDCSEIIVALPDSGVFSEHEDLADNIWTNPNEIADNGIDDDHNGYIDDVHGYDFGEKDNDLNDTSGHGTHVAGIISAVTNNSIGIASAARNAKIVPLKIHDREGDISTSAIYGALLYIKNNNFPIANCSWAAINTIPR